MILGPTYFFWKKKHVFLFFEINLGSGFFLRPGRGVLALPPPPGEGSVENPPRTHFQDTLQNILRLRRADGVARDSFGPHAPGYKIKQKSLPCIPMWGELLSIQNQQHTHSIFCFQTCLNHIFF